MRTKLRQRREELGYTQEYVARHLNITNHAYGKKELGQREVTVGEGIKLARLYKTTVEELFG